MSCNDGPKVRLLEEVDTEEDDAEVTGGALQEIPQRWASGRMNLMNFIATTAFLVKMEEFPRAWFPFLHLIG